MRQIVEAPRTMVTIEGNLIAPKDARFVLVATRFNELVVDQMIKGAQDALIRHGAAPERLTLIKVPGAWELPLVCRRVAKAGKAEGIVALGAVIRGGTPHFEFVAGAGASGLRSVTDDTGVPIGFGLLTTDTIEQAIERAGTKAGNKGAEAALAALEMVTLSAQLTAHEL